jgi:hypothetical protein
MGLFVECQDLSVDPIMRFVTFGLKDDNSISALLTKPEEW